MKKIKLTEFKILSAVALLLILAVACKEKPKDEDSGAVAPTEEQKPFFKLSLAEWSLHNAINDGTFNPFDFAQKAKEMGFDGIEYVNHLYNKQIDSLGLAAVLDTLKVKSEKYGVENLLIMVDGEGDLATGDDKVRSEAVENHKKWVDAASFLGCHSIRVNLFGSDTPEAWVTNSKKGLHDLAQYAKTKNINVIVENHGGFSSDAELLNQVIENAGVDNVGTLPDFGNFCLKREDGKRWDAPCVEEYDRYKGVEQLMKHAKGVSGKSYDFDENGNETTIDFARMLKIVKDSGYTGFIDVEYEGTRLPEEAGIEATRDLLIKYGQ